MNLHTAIGNIEIRFPEGCELTECGKGDARVNTAIRLYHQMLVQARGELKEWEAHREGCFAYYKHRQSRWWRLLRSRPVRWLRWSAGIDTRGKVVAAIFMVTVSILLRNEIVIWVARADLDEWLTRGLIYFVGFATYVVGAHFNHWCFGKKEWR